MFTKGTKTFLALVAFSITLTLNAFAAESSAEAEAPISRQRAQEIALQQVNGGRIVEAEFNDRWFRDDDYEFVVVDNMHRYIVSVDARTGEVLDVKQDKVFEDNLLNTERARLETGASAVTSAANAADSAIDSAASAAKSAAVSAGNAVDRAASATRNAAVSAENAVDRAAGSLDPKDRVDNVRPMSATTDVR